MAVGEMTGPALDVATGTGDFTFDLLGHPQVTHVVGLDFTRAMLPLAIEKATTEGPTTESSSWPGTLMRSRSPTTGSSVRRSGSESVTSSTFPWHCGRCGGL